MTPDPRDTDPLYVAPVVIRCSRCDNPLPFGRIGRCDDCIGRSGNPVGCVLVVVLAVVLAAVLFATPRSAPASPTPSPAAVNVTASEGASALTSPMPASRFRGLATWYCLSGSSACTAGTSPDDMVAAIDSDLGFVRSDRIRVRYGDRSVVVTIRDVCGCPGERLVDLTSGAFRRLAPLGTGVIPVTIELAGPGVTLPPTTTTEETP